MSAQCNWWGWYIQSLTGCISSTLKMLWIQGSFLSFASGLRSCWILFYVFVVGILAYTSIFYESSFRRNGIAESNCYSIPFTFLVSLLFLGRKRNTTLKSDVGDVCCVTKVHLSFCQSWLPVAFECCSISNVLINILIDTGFCNLFSCAHCVLTQVIDSISSWRIAQKSVPRSCQTLIPSASQELRVYSYHSDSGYLQVWCSAHFAFFFLFFAV